MRGTWKLRLRMWLTTILMFSIVYFFVMLVARYLKINSWFFFMAVSLIIVFLQYWYGPTLVKHSMNVRPLSEAEAPNIHQMVEELAQAADVPKPEVCISEINIPNAFGDGRQRSVALDLNSHNTLLNKKDAMALTLERAA